MQWHWAKHRATLHFRAEPFLPDIHRIPRSLLRLFWRATLRRCHCVWDECVATTERCPPGEYREAYSGFLEGNAPSLPWCGTSVWQRQSVALQVNASELTPGCLTVLVIASCCLMLLTRGSAFSF